LLVKALDEYVYDPIPSKERLPQSPFRRLELIPEAARDIIKVKTNDSRREKFIVVCRIKNKLLPQLRQRNQIVAIDLKEFVESHLIKTSAWANKHDASKHEEQIRIWSRERQEQLDDQIHRFVIEQKKIGIMEHLRLLEEREELLNFFENESRIIMHSHEKAFAAENFDDVRAPGEHEYFELARVHYHWNRMEPRRSLHQDKKLRDEEMSDVRNWPSYKYLAENWKYDLVDYVPLDEKMKRRKEDKPPSGKQPYYKQFFF
jgi:hypothetical protein